MAGIIKDGQVYAGVVTDDHIKEVIKSNIATTISNTSTKEELVSAKDVYDDVISKHELKELKVNFGEPTDLTKIGISDYTTLTSLLEITKTLGTNYRLVMQVNGVNKQTLFDNGIIPYNDSGLLIITVQSIRGSAIFTTDGNLTYVTTTSNAINTEWKAWQRVCTTSVADVPRTIITDKLASTKVSFTNSDSYVSYYVKNGDCYVTMWSMKILEACSVEVIFKALPKSAIGVTRPLCNGKESFAQIFISPNSSNIAVNASADLVGKSGYCSLSYPVAES